MRLKLMTTTLFFAFTFCAIAGAAANTTPLIGVAVNVTTKDGKAAANARVIFEGANGSESRCLTGVRGTCTLYLQDNTRSGSLEVFWGQSYEPVGGGPWQGERSIHVRLSARE